MSTLVLCIEMKIGKKKVARNGRAYGGVSNTSGFSGEILVLAVAARVTSREMVLAEDSRVTSREMVLAEDSRVTV